MDFLIIAALGLCAFVAFAAARRPQPEGLDHVVATSPVRVIHPARANRPDVHAWILRASPECELTHSMLNNHRYSTEAAPPLPTIGCRLTDCRCHYDTILSTRRTDRRQAGNDRRGMFRFGARGDRRQHAERRDRGWGSTNLLR